MVIRKKEQRVAELNGVRGGDGTIGFVYRAPAEVFHHEKMIAEITIPPGGSIGYHEHKNEVEFYIIQSGQGLVNDNGVETVVRRGDCVITGNGSSHSIKNTGTAPLVFEAVIIGY
ncbi:MAG: cupin domain-containing protein [Spirochaetaceae bacterium]|jgi:mannose-6-phosphate isomerase-like protein (cupin superfamily)|nr:cupin domain-containing protein [Spirochaetaceae bacterium]